MKRIFILLLVITGLYIVFNFSFSFDGLAFNGNKEGSTSITNRTDKIQIEAAGVRADIIPEDRDDLTAVLTGKGNLKVEKQGNTIQVSLKKNWFDWFSSNKNENLKIYIPKDYSKSMHITLGSGRLNFSGESMQLEELTLTIGSGSANLGHLDVKTFNQNLSSGDVQIEQLTVEKGDFEVSSGNVNIKHYIGAIDADISSGDFKIQLDKLIDSLDIDLSSGDVVLDLPEDADFELEGKVSSGDISSDFPLTSKDTSGKNIYGKHGSGEHKIEISVSSGEVQIK
ncbi:DUF4097 domain-containing protein [Bacillus sp. MRMR6]|uniref:LiaG family protein n=1 Tax=Bacillus sp. MRMR6 TaxID=1928617 RepID=UPI0009515DE7|nr:DUF4097 domain-containing protein [Bacillus sp. MRMR6]OLS40647.1 hypothetical protein BTR25_08600 [Bacillus sp. MRMR6]